ncbi:MAG: hypothetical protein IT381_04095 [Deltaproteobacteria bacterium]|nr:hypothetical protein [Deltaproteobacteria bacterium]
MSQTCAMSCNAPGEPCREGCCQQPIAGIDGTCQAGLSPSACGENGMTCQDCGPLLCVDVGPPTGGTCQ